MVKTTSKVTVDRHLAHYLRVLRLKPGASPEDVATAYYTLRKSLPDTDSPEGQKRAQELDHAFGIVKVRYRTRRKRMVRKRLNRVLATSVTVLLLLSLFSYFQLSARLRPYLVNFEVGDVLYRIDDKGKFGEVVSYEADHLFPAGSRRDAYRIRLHPSGAEAWVSATTARRGLKTN